MKKVLALGVVIIFCLGIIGCEKTNEGEKAVEPETFVVIQQDEIVSSGIKNLIDKN